MKPMRKVEEIETTYCCNKVNTPKMPVFKCGDAVFVSLEPVTPEGKFYSGMCGTVSSMFSNSEKVTYAVVLHHLQDPTCVIPNTIYIDEVDLILDQVDYTDEDGEEFCVYVPHGVETSLTPEEIQEKFKYQWDDGEGVYYCVVSREDYEKWLNDDDAIIEEDEDGDFEVSHKKS